MSEEKVTVSLNGPLKVEGEIKLTDHEGNPIATKAGGPFFLCRCGASQNKPFCDGSHNKAGFTGS